MQMPSYPIYCTSPGCKNLAAYKIAARWSDGMQSELKTYGLVCADCLPAWFRKTREQQHACRPAPGEELGPAGIYQLERGLRERKLQRLDDLEKSLS